MLSENEHRILKVAHRGGAGLAPENTLAAFRRALQLRAHAVELDVHMSQDGALVVIHDPDVVVTTDGTGEVGDLALATLKTLNAAANFKGPATAPQRIPTLQEVLTLVQGHADVQIEIKQRANGRRYPGIEVKILEALRQHRMLDQVVAISFDFPTLQELKALQPNLQICALISTPYLRRLNNVRWDAAPVLDDLAAHGFDCVGVKHTWLTQPLLNALRAGGFRVGVWTVNEPLFIRQFVQMGVDFITSDRPDLLNDILDAPQS
ncbi:Glycerophosphodiester phosphodiesterase [Candidatus Entotheonellaceae bacterium PAL068K]